MRYVIVSKGVSIEFIQQQISIHRGKNVKAAPAMRQVFCDLDDAAAEKLKTTPGIAVRSVGKVATDIGVPRLVTRQPIVGPGLTPYEIMAAQQPTYAASQASIASQMYDLRALVDPPVLGSGVTIVIMDTGIRKTHRGLLEKVVYEVDFSGSETPNDVFSHGTAVAYMAAGGRHAPGEECGIAPGAYLMNIKVIGDDGMGTDESVILGMEEVMRLWAAAEAEGLSPFDPMYPNIINMSFGKVDNDDPDDPLRVAAQAFYEQSPPATSIYAAAGNAGPDPSTITLPASVKGIAAIGAITFVPYDIWSYSSRGPTLEGLTKPDYLFYGVDLLLASGGGDDAFEVKSGTSFSCPAYAGFWAIAMEGLPRIAPPETVAIFLETPTEEWMDVFGPILAAMSVKPVGAPVGKDDTYGYGMVIGSLVASQLGGVRGTSVSSLLEAIPAIAMLSMMPGLMSGV